MSVIAVERRRIGSAGGRDDIIFAQVEKHLAVVVGIVPDDDGSQAQPRVWPGIRPLDGVEHILGVDSAH